MKTYFIILPILYGLVKSFSWIFKYIFSLSNNYKVWESLHGKFVVVTNATTTLGEALCSQLVEKGLKLIIIDDSEEKLISLKQRLMKKTKILYYAIDFSLCSDFSFLKKYDIGLLINLIVLKNYKPQYFINQKIDSTIDLYMRSQFHMMKTVMTSMAEKHKGYILNINFGYSIQPKPLSAFISASIAGYKSWSESMYYEMMPSNVNVEFMDLGPYCQSELEKPTFFKPTPSKVAKYIASTLGSSYFTVPYYPHMIEYFFIFICPSSLVARYRSNINEVLIRTYRNS